MAGPPRPGGAGGGSHGPGCSISDGSLYSRNNASGRYNVAIEAQKQKECHSMNLSV